MARNALLHGVRPALGWTIEGMTAAGRGSSVDQGRGDKIRFSCSCAARNSPPPKSSDADFSRLLLTLPRFRAIFTGPVTLSKGLSSSRLLPSWHPPRASSRT